METARAFAIHVFTACGAALGFIALILAVGELWAAMFFCLGMAAIIDGIDGPLARVVKVHERLPRWSGDTLDLVVDYTTYVFVPAYAITASGVLPQALALLSGIVIVITGALYFADREMKTRDNYFRGFPAVWNVVAFYLFVLQPWAWLATLLVIVCAVFTFLPVTFLHPLRVEQRRGLNIALLGLWCLLGLIAVLSNLNPALLVKMGLVAIVIYFLAAGFLRRA